MFAFAWAILLDIILPWLFGPLAERVQRLLRAGNVPEM